MSKYEQNKIDRLQITIRSLKEKVDRLERANLQRRAITGRGGGGAGESAPVPLARFIKWTATS